MPRAEAVEPFVADLNGSTEDVEFAGHHQPSKSSGSACTAQTFCAHLRSAARASAWSSIEAFAAGTPVVASDIAGYRQVVTHGKDGLLVPLGAATRAG